MTITVGLLRKWKVPEEIMRQSPKRVGIWGDIQLVEPPAGPVDYVVILNRPAQPTVVHCPPENIWAIIDEPPNEVSRHWHRGFDSYQRIFTQDFTLRGPRYVLSHPALPWLVDRDYDYLVNCPVPQKTKALSWITSDRNDTGGHRLRMRFLAQLRESIDFDLYGRGFQPIEDKWDGLAPYRYAIAVENFHTPYYWSEKIADCFLAWTMPIYSGSSRIEQYFPKEAMVRIDIRDPQAIEQVREVISSDRWQRNLDAIAEARQLVLNRYQLFPFLAQQIAAQEACRGIVQRPQPQAVAIEARTNPFRFAYMLARKNFLRLVRDNPRWRTYGLE